MKPTPAVKVLDQGFVRLVEFMGGDGAVVDAARVCTGASARAGGRAAVEKDRRLIDYLLSHQHTTPFEHSVFKFHVSCPLFVMRQWIRHRSSCLTGDTQLIFDLPSGPRQGKPRRCRMSIEEFHRKWQVGAKPIPHARKPTSQIIIPQRARLQRMLLRNLREDAWSFGHTHVVDVYRTGEKPVFEVTLADGKTIRCTKEHRFLFENGWQTLEQATRLVLTGGLASYRKDLPRLAVNGRAIANPPYRDREWLEVQYRRDGATDASIAHALKVSPDVIKKWRRIHGLTHIKTGDFQKGALPVENLATLCAPCHRRVHRTNSEVSFAAKLLGQPAVRPYEAMERPRAAATRLVPRWSRIASIRYIGVQPTFDLAVEGPFHNYVANGIVTHNSYNEISARYAEVRDAFYLPEQWRGQDIKNRQSSSASGAIDGKRCTAVLKKAYSDSYQAYQELLKAGVAREMARFVMPVGIYTQFYWTVSARNLMHFINLRADSHAQWEIQRYAEALASLFAAKMPWTWEAFLRRAWTGANPSFDAVRLSAGERSSAATDP